MKNYLKSSSRRFFVTAQLNCQLHAVGEGIVEVLHASLDGEPGVQWGHDIHSGQDQPVKAVCDSILELGCVLDAPLPVLNQV